MPLKALKESQFRSLAEAVTSSGSHETRRVEFTDANGDVKTGYYKPLDLRYLSYYSTFSGKYAVFASLFIAMSCKRVAEERLVFNDSGQIVGTFSYEVAGFKPLWGLTALGGQPVLPEDPIEKELVYPSLETLLGQNIAEILIEAFIVDEDDFHPGNVSLAGIIDRDMSFWSIIRYIKGGRFSELIVGVWRYFMGTATKANVFDNFPFVTDRTFWPTLERAGNGNYGKTFAAHVAFQALAKDPVFHEQVFSAALKKSVLFSPSLFRSRATEYFGDLPLGFKPSASEQTNRLSEIFPDLFNDATNDQSFVEHAVIISKKKHDELYRALVFYPGCEKNASGVAVRSFCDFLEAKPSAYREIEGWVIAENQQMENSWNKYQALLSEDASKADMPLDAYCVPPEFHYDLKAIQERYHQIWRDAHAYQVTDYLNGLRDFYNELAEKSSSPPLPALVASHVFSPLMEGEHPCSWGFISCVENQGEGISVDEKRLQSMLAVINETIEQSNLYYRESTCFNEGYCLDVIDPIFKFKAVLDDDVKFDQLLTQSHTFTRRINFQKHLSREDIASETRFSAGVHTALTQNHTDKKVLDRALPAFFNWLNQYPQENFNSIVEEVLKEYCKGALGSRALEVRSYLKKVKRDDRANQLAYILSSGGCASNSLNTVLMKNMMGLFLDSGGLLLDHSLVPIAVAYTNGTFDAMGYAIQASQYAKQAPEFTHLYSKQVLTQVNRALYRWVDALEQGTFQTLINAALDDYNPPSLLGWSLSFLVETKARAPIVKKLLTDNKLINSQLLAKVFSEGTTTQDSLNHYVFHRLLITMQGQSHEKSHDPDFLLISSIGVNAKAALFHNDYAHFIGSLAGYAKAEIIKEDPIVVEDYSAAESVSCH